jgi:hypothetical protein
LLVARALVAWPTAAICQVRNNSYCSFPVSLLKALRALWFSSRVSGGFCYAESRRQPRKHAQRREQARWRRPRIVAGVAIESKPWSCPGRRRRSGASARYSDPRRRQARPNFARISRPSARRSRPCPSWRLRPGERTTWACADGRRAAPPRASRRITQNHSQNATRPYKRTSRGGPPPPPLILQTINYTTPLLPTPPLLLNNT